MTFEQEVFDTINSTDQMFIENYFDLQRKSEARYGENALVFVEVGSFYEIYETDDIGKASEIAKTLNILLTKKNKKIKEVSVSNPRLCGIPNVSLEKHLEKLTSENKWTIVLISQEGRPPKIERKLNKIISPGTNIDYIENDDKRFMASIYVEKNANGVYSAGLTLLDPTIGEILIYENYGNASDREVILDEVNQILHTYNVSEVIAHSDEAGIIERDGVIYREAESVSIAYQEELVKHSFNIDTTHLTAIESLDMERMPFALNSLSSLLDFVIEHNRLLGISLQKPKQIYSSKYVYLGNNPISQLDIQKKEGIDLLDVVNGGITAIGRRYIKEQLLNPIKDRVEIESRLRTSLEFVNHPRKKDIEDRLRGVYDMERILRKCEIGTVQPFEFSNLYKSLMLIREIKDIKGLEDSRFDGFLAALEGDFDFETMGMSNLTNITQTFVKKGVSKELDELQQRLDRIESEKDLGLSEVFVLKETESEGLYYEITNKKYEEFSQELSVHEVETVKSLKNSKKVFIKVLSGISQERVFVMDKLVKMTKAIFYEAVERLDVELVRENVDFLSRLEFHINNARLYENKGYCVPEFVESKDNFYEAELLRHPIVESIEKEVFIPNNVQFGGRGGMRLDTSVCFNEDNVRGYLLYGQNSSGKTVLSKSIGLSVMMAQSGFFVSAKSLRLSVFESIFTRISGSDDLVRGLSTFAVEMLELKNILNRADSRSMIIGDEISHGTETVSGLSIVAAAILSLKEKGSSFIIATHLHQLDTIKDVRESTQISEIHLSLNYDQDQDRLIYNRKIQKGKGSSVYGLEFAKSLKLPQEFLTRAYRIRKEVADDLSGLEELTKKRKSRYNSSVYVGVCHECGDAAKDVHHIKEQKEADESGRVGHMRIHHKANLKPLCKKCHNKEHSPSPARGLESGISNL